jgi:hypothetical protein
MTEAKSLGLAIFFLTAKFADLFWPVLVAIPISQ